MWLRDLLPLSAQFDKSRIITFGYNSTLVNKTSNDRIQDWADELLRQVGYVRTTAVEQSRPIIFVCHSLGGLVGRQAMVRLQTNPNKFDGLRLKHCGLLFLSTPHSGTTQADWNTFLMSVSELTVGVRSEAIVDQLRSFNPASVDSEDAFSAMERIPPMYCLVEGEKTKVAGKARTVGLGVFVHPIQDLYFGYPYGSLLRFEYNVQIVTQASAGFHGKTADKILNTDHHTICKFDTKFGGYMAVLDRLRKLKVAVTDEGAASSGGVQNV